MLKDRVKSAVIIVSCLIVWLFLDVLFSTALFSGILALGIIWLAIAEYTAIVQKRGAKPFFKASCLFAIPLILLHASPDASIAAYMCVALLFFIVIAVLQVMRNDQDAPESLGVTLLGYFYFAVLTSFLYKIRLLEIPGGSGEASGIQALFYFIIVVKSSDIGAYFTGREFGTTKLIPQLSPGKTVAGFVGGIISSALVALLLCNLVGFGFFAAVSFGALMAVLGQAGDLFESMLKRSADVKDSGAMIPGMGGVLDIVDSLVLTAPVGYLMLSGMV